jgi:hypothetical protein
VSQSNRVFLAALTASLVVFVTVPARSDLIYRETYGRPAIGQAGTSSANILGDVYDWPLFRTTSTSGGAMLHVTDPTTGIGGVSGNAASGKPTNVANFNAGNNEDGTTVAYARGIYFMANTIGTENGAPDLAFTTEYQVDPASYSNLTFSWYQGDNGPNSALQLAIRIGSQWYANATQFTGPNVGGIAGFAANAAQKQVVYDPTAANWVTFSFDGDWNSSTHTLTQDGTVPFAFGAAPSSDLSGPITAFGLLGANGVTSEIRRFDTFEINATPVPEPSSVVLAICALAGCGMLCRKQLPTS